MTGISGHGLLEWLQNLIVPRDARKLTDIKNIYEKMEPVVALHLRDWTVAMRKFKQGRKTMYHYIVSENVYT